MVGSVVVAKDAFPRAEVPIRVMHADRIAQLSADDLINVEGRTIPEIDSTTHKPVVVIRGKARDGFLDLTNADILPQAAFDGGKVVVNRQAPAGSERCINWRTGKEVKYK